MVLKSEILKDICGKIYTALDNQSVSTLTESVELKTVGSALYMSVTNREYYCQVKIDIDEPTDFHATVKADTFLKLIPQITTDTIELTVTENNLKIVGNGLYKAPLVFDDNGGNNLLELPQIEIKNVKNDFYINSAVLLSILKHNSEELNKGTISKPVQKLFYIDDEGALTFTSGACINSFTLSEPIKILLNARVVKLFKLFKDGDVHFTLGLDPISDELSQVKVKFETEDVVISAILPSSTDALIATVPVKKIRERASRDYTNVVYLKRDELTDAVNRLSLFVPKNKPYGIFEFDTDQVTMYDLNKENKEVLYYSKTSTVTEPYTLNLDLDSFKITLKSANEEVELRFGDRQAVIMEADPIKNVIPEIKFSNV